MRFNQQGSHAYILDGRWPLWRIFYTRIKITIAHPLFSLLLQDVCREGDD